MSVRQSRRRASTMVEMAIALPVFLLLVAGIFTLGMIYNHQMAINTAARDGARLAAVGHTDAEVLAQIKGITPNLDHDPSRFGAVIMRGERSVICVVEYTEKVHWLPVLGILFNNKKLTARQEHFYETDWIQR